MSDDEDDSYSIVEYMSDHSGYRCGYCKSKDTNYSHGMWAHQLTVQNYQDLIDRGWRRSGKYCYKPTMQKTCCPQYTIKCDPLQFKLSNSQKKVLKCMHSYLSYDKKKTNSGSFEGNETTGVHEASPSQPLHNVTKDLSDVKMSIKSFKKQCKASNHTTESEMSCEENTHSESPEKIDHQTTQADLSTTGEVKVNPGLGRDPSKPPRKKAKLLRKERRSAKLVSRSGDARQSGDKSQVKGGADNQTKSLEDFLDAPLPKSPAHRLEVRLVLAVKGAAAYDATLDASHRLYQRYQMSVHKEPESKLTRRRYQGFLCDSTLQPWHPASGPSDGYGPFHHQYWLDGQLIAVGVLDVLPHCISSVYLYYDPKFSFLSLGVYSSLREIALTRQLHRATPTLRWYYMGFYIHSCPKMRYKGNYNPSFLLCPETYTWIHIDKCVPKLNASKYSRLNDDHSIRQEKLNIDTVFCLYGGMPCLYSVLRLRIRPKVDDEDEVREYLALAGSKAATSLMLYRSK